MPLDWIEEFISDGLEYVVILICLIHFDGKSMPTQLSISGCIVLNHLSQCLLIAINVINDLVLDSFIGS